MAEIVLTNVTKRWGQYYAVDHLNLEIDDNAFVTLLGPSGCGKTTTLRMIAGLETPTEGRITIDGVPMFDSAQGINVPANKRRVGFLFQNYALWPNMTVYQNIAFGLSNIKDSGAHVNEKGEVMRDETGKQPVRKLDKAEIDRVVKRVSKIVKIGMFLERYPSELSGGQQQRVAIARTLAPGPRVLFMDEPLSNLDAKLRLEMRSELQRLHLETGSTFIYVTHDQMEAMTLATKICLINNGVLQQYDAPLTVYNKPNNLFVADFVGNPAVNFIEGKGKQQADGTVQMEILNGLKVNFVPNAAMRVDQWFLEEKAQDKSRSDAEMAAKNDKKNVEKSNKDTVFKYHIAKASDEEAQGTDAANATDNDFVLGVRPEFISICEDGNIEGEIFSAMPTGMETTVKVKIGDFLLTGVMFGGVLYKLGQKVRLKFTGNNAMLFSRENGRLITQGSLNVM